MIAGLIYDQEKSELNIVRKEAKDAIADLSEEDSSIAICTTAAELDRHIGETDLENFSCIDIATDGQIQMAEQVRKKYPDTSMLLIVDMNQPPNTYIKPSIMAASLLLRPATPDGIRHTMREFLGSSLAEKNEKAGDAYILEGKAGSVRIPYQSIYYIEANNKRLFIRLRAEEYSFFGTLEKMAEALPEDFVRCHRGFLVNKTKIKQYLTAENVLVLEDDTRLPVSRSYKSAMREILK